MQVQKWARPSLEMAEWAIQISVGRRHILPILPALFRALKDAKPCRKRQTRDTHPNIHCKAGWLRTASLNITNCSFWVRAVQLIRYSATSDIHWAWSNSSRLYANVTTPGKNSLHNWIKEKPLNTQTTLLCTRLGLHQHSTYIMITNSLYVSVAFWWGIFKATLLHWNHGLIQEYN